MLIRRCAWHREFHGYTLIHGVADWRGLSLRFTDGVCRGCAERVRIEWRVAGQEPVGDPRRGAPISGGRLRGAVLAGGLVLVVVTLFSIKPVLDRRAAEIHEQYPVAVGGEAAMAGRSGTVKVAEAEPPRVSRHRAGSTARARKSWRHASKRALPVARLSLPANAIPSPPLPMFSSMVPPDAIEDQFVPAPPSESSNVASSLNRPVAPEDEFSLRVRRASLIRLSLSPPPERPRHAGLTIQGP